MDHRVDHRVRTWSVRGACVDHAWIVCEPCVDLLGDHYPLDALYMPSMTYKLARLLHREIHFILGSKFPLP